MPWFAGRHSVFCPALALRCPVALVLTVATSMFGVSHGVFLRSSSSPPSASKLKPLCRVAAPTGNQGSSFTLDVWQLPGNQRSISFEDSQTYESKIQCSGDVAQVCEPLALDAEINDVTQCPSCPCEIDEEAELQPSVAVLFQKLAGVCEAATGLDVLNLGLGGGTLHSHLRHRCPATTRVRSVEIDPRVATTASRYFGVPLEAGASEVVVGDASAVVASLAAGLRAGSPTHPGDPTVGGGNRAAVSTDEEPLPLGKGGWDVVVVDCFIGGGRTPESCRSDNFVQNLRAILKPNGVVLHHLWHESPSHPTVATDFSSALSFYKSAFGAEHVEVVPVWRPQASLMLDDIVISHA